ncbi:cytochrome c [Flavobacterium sp.]|uniref:cytochrome c n=1 Tax=Flavobacterium sp. TaxID=239 RepID=UPI00391C3C16
MNPFQKTTRKILVSASIFLIFIISLFYIFYNNSEPKKFVCKIGANLPVCGTKNLSPEAEQGKQLFNSTCAACHKLDAKSIGPALRNTDSIVFEKWLNYKNLKIDSLKFDKLKIDYHRNLSKKNFTESELKKIYAYISGS